MTSCPKCSTTHNPDLCQGHVVKDPTTREPIPPRQCGKQPMKAQRVCRSHGGSTAKSRAAAEHRQAEATAREVISQVWPGLSADRRVTDPLAALEQLAGAQQSMLEVFGERINSMGNFATGKDLAQLRADWIAYKQIERDYQTNLHGMVRAGIAERYVELEKAKVEIVTAALLTALEGAGLEQGVRDVVVAGFLQGLGRGPVVAGEVTR